MSSFTTAPGTRSAQEGVETFTPATVTRQDRNSRENKTDEAIYNVHGSEDSTVKISVLPKRSVDSMESPKSQKIFCRNDKLILKFI